MFPAGGKSGFRAPALKRFRKPLGLAVVVCLLAIGAEAAALAPERRATGAASITRSTSTSTSKKHEAPGPLLRDQPERRTARRPAEFARMKRGGIRSYRIPFGWSAVWPSFGRPLNWA